MVLLWRPDRARGVLHRRGCALPPFRFCRLRHLVRLRRNQYRDFQVCERCPHRLYVLRRVRGGGDGSDRLSRAPIRARMMRIYSNLEETNVRTYALVREWTRSGLLEEQQGARLADEVRPALKRTNN